MNTKTSILAASIMATCLSTPLLAASTLETSSPEATTSQQQQKEPKQKGQRRQRHFQHIDANKDGGLTLEEMRKALLARLDERFKRMDADGDGLISAAEFKPHKGRMRKAGHKNPE